MPAKTVLEVDDDPGALEGLARLLRQAGYGAATVANGVEALLRLRDGPAPCLILLDLLMPVLDGWSFCEALRADPATARTPVIVCSGAPPSLQQSGSLALNVQAFHPKAVDPAALLATVRSLCG
jgi:CheY-like chemotaxis protein